MGNGLPLSSSRSNAALRSTVVLNRFSGSGSRHRRMMASTASESSGRGARRRRRGLHALHQFGDGTLRALAPPAADEHVVEDQAERIDVGTLIDRLSARLLWRHVGDRADDGACLRG